MTQETALTHSPAVLSTVLVASPLWQESIRDLLMRERLATVLAMCREFDSLAPIMKQHRPDLLVARLLYRDVQDPSPFRTLRREHPNLAMLLLVPRHATRGFLRQIAGLGGVAILTTDANLSELRGAIELTTRGWAALSPDVRENVFEGLGDEAPETPIVLTEREIQILAATASGSDDKTIAGSLGLGMRTVKLDVARARDKLGAMSRIHAVALALRYGFIEPKWIAEGKQRPLAKALNPYGASEEGGESQSE